MLFGVVEHLRRIPARRKAVLWFSRGGSLPANYFEPVERTRGRDDDVFSKLIDTARAANVAIYTVDPRGLQTPAAEVSRDGEPFDTTVVRDLAGATGGRALLGNFPNAALERVAAENRAYYLIGYAPAASTGKDRPRKLKRPDTRAWRLPPASTGLPAVCRGRDVRGEPDRVASAGAGAANCPGAVGGRRRRQSSRHRRARSRLAPDCRMASASSTRWWHSTRPARSAARASGVIKARDGHAIGEARLAVEAKIYEVRLAAKAARSLTLKAWRSRP